MQKGTFSGVAGQGLARETAYKNKAAYQVHWEGFVNTEGNTCRILGLHKGPEAGTWGGVAASKLKEGASNGKDHQLEGIPANVIWTFSVAATLSLVL